ncbi:MAG: helix-turn-helix domain-containing protein [Methyloceanibacter sp.]|jgi:transcriptional regulator with XRE-family HTH domain
MITRLQVRLGRTALGWGVRDLARKAGVSPTTVTRFENGAHTRVDTVALFQDVLERAGVVFIAADERGGPGVRLREPRRSLVRTKSENQST